MGPEKRVLKKNNLIRSASRKTRMLFCQEKRNSTKEDWKKLFSSDETMVVIKNGGKIQTWGKSRGCSRATVLEHMLIKCIFGVIVRDHPFLAVSAG